MTPQLSTVVDENEQYSPDFKQRIELDLKLAKNDALIQKINSNLLKQGISDESSSDSKAKTVNYKDHIVSTESKMEDSHSIPSTNKDADVNFGDTEKEESRMSLELKIAVSNSNMLESKLKEMSLALQSAEKIKSEFEFENSKLTIQVNQKDKFIKTQREEIDDARFKQKALELKNLELSSSLQLHQDYLSKLNLSIASKNEEIDKLNAIIESFRANSMSSITTSKNNSSVLSRLTDDEISNLILKQANRIEELECQLEYRKSTKSLTEGSSEDRQQEVSILDIDLARDEHNIDLFSSPKEVETKSVNDKKQLNNYMIMSKDDVKAYETEIKEHKQTINELQKHIAGYDSSSMRSSISPRVEIPLLNLPKTSPD